MANRLLCMGIVFLAAFSFLLCNLALLSTNGDYAAAAKNQSEETLLLNEGRGNIYDCDFVPLTNAQYTVYALFSPGSKSYRTWFDTVAEDDKTAFYENIQRIQPFLASVDPDDAEKLPYTFYNPERYWADPIAPHLIGYRDAEGNGVAGLELVYNDLLKGASTKEEVACVTNARGAFLDEEPYTPRVLYTEGSGDGVMMTLDAEIQRICEGIASEKMERGSIVVLDSATGRVRASVSMPVYDPLNVAASIRRNDTSLVNRAVSSFNVGSVFKPILAEAALEAGFDPQAEYECVGATELNGHVYRCANGTAHGRVNLQTALEQSCNCYFIELGLALGGQRLHTAAKDTGFGVSSVIAGRLLTTAGDLPTAEELADKGQLASVSFGQGALTASPLQVAAAINVFATGGRYIEPSFIEGIVDEYSETLTQSLYAPLQRQVCTAETAETVRMMMQGVVENGLGKAAHPLKMTAAGKTGTAQTGRYDENGEELLNAWFAGFFPAEDPQYTVCVLLDDGFAGSTQAAEIFADVANALYFSGFTAENPA